MILVEQVARYLHAQSLGTFDKTGITGNIFTDSFPTGDNKICIYNRGGIEPDIKNGYLSSGIQIIYRGTKDPIASYTIANNIFLALYDVKSTVFYAGQNDIVSCISDQSQPEGIGVDENGEHEYSMNFIIELAQ